MRRLSVTALALAAAVLCQPARAADPIKIGVMFPLTGPISVQAAPERDAIKEAFDEVHYTVAGRKIELLIEDSAGHPDTGLTKVKALVERDKVDLLLGELVGSVGAAIAPYVTAKKIPWVNTVGISTLTRKEKSPYIFRFAPSAYQYGVAAAESAKKLGWKKVYFIGWNAPAGHESAAAAKKIFGAANVLDPMFPNVGTADFAPYLTHIDPSKANGLLVAVWGADAPRITQQYAEYGLSKKLPMFGIASFTSEELLGHMPPQTVGVYSAYTYCGTLDTPENKAFIAGYEKRYHRLPGSYQYMGYQAAKMMIQAIKDVKGNVKNRKAFIAALEKVHIKGPMGVTRFDKNHGIVADFYVLKVEKGPNGHLRNRCIDRLPQVEDPYNLFP